MPAECLPNAYRTSTERKTIANLEKTNIFLGFLEVGYRQNWSELSGLSHTDIGVAKAGYPAFASGISSFRERDIQLREPGYPGWTVVKDEKGKHQAEIKFKTEQRKTRFADGKTFRRGRCAFAPDLFGYKRRGRRFSDWASWQRGKRRPRRLF